MFDQLFERSHALARHLSGPLVDERRRYLVRCAEQGMAKSTLRRAAELLKAAEGSLKLADRPFASITIQEIEEAGSRCSRRKALPPIRLHPGVSLQRLICTSVRWLTFLNRLRTL